MRRLFTFFLLFSFLKVQAQTSYSKIISITTSVDSAVGSVTLRWDKIPTATGYSISKKLREGQIWTTVGTAPTVNDTTFTDIITDFSKGYEYQVVTIGASIVASSSIYAGINFPPKHFIGKLIILIDSAYINYCSQEINQYLTDIVKEGWSYQVAYISRSLTPPAVKQVITSLYLQDTLNTRGVFILGHIAIPYSGSIYPDGHQDHRGAWPADSYYADTSFSIWTDTIINLSTASRLANRNIPGDGKFDQWAVNPNAVRLFVTRVDLYDMPSINANDSLLIKNYLIKDHEYRSFQKKFRMKALVDDNFGYFAGEAFGQNGFRNGANLLGKDSTVTADYFTGMNTNATSYLWSFGCGAGTYTSAGGIGSTSNFVTSEVNSVFTMLFGSYFGDWDNSNNFLRAPLASNSSVLTNCWAGRPNWSFHAMGLGECIGFTAYAQLKTPTVYTPTNYGANFIHAALLGDPTLKMYVYAPPKNLAMVQSSGILVNLSWLASEDPQVTGYYVYRSSSLNKPFTLLNTIPVSTLSFVDSTATLGNNVYMVRAVKLQKTVSSGTFYNLSSGVLDSIVVSTPLPVQLIQFTAQKRNNDHYITWKTAKEINIDSYELLFSTDGVQYNPLIIRRAEQSNKYTFLHNDINNRFAGLTVYYKLKINDRNGSFTYSKVIAIHVENFSKIEILENPVNNFITINGIPSEGDINILDASGKTVMQRQVKQGSLQLYASFLRPGLYFLLFVNDKKSYTIKFVKK